MKRKAAIAILEIIVLFAGLIGLLGKGKSGIVTAFVIDSAHSLTPGDKKELSLFRKVTHGGIVCSIFKSYGKPDKILFYNVDDYTGRISTPNYLNTLQLIDDYTERNPGNRVVVNISFGSYSTDLKEAIYIKRLINKEVIIVAAAGNERTEKLIYPAAYNGVIAVAASDKKEKAEYSNYGGYVDICTNGKYQSSESISLPTDTGYAVYTRKLETDGTSFAAPKVAGTIAKMLRLDPTLSNEKVISILKKTARPMETFYYRDGDLGAGLLNRSGAFREIDKYYLLKFLYGDARDFLSSMWGILILFLASFFLWTLYSLSGGNRLGTAGFVGSFLGIPASISIARITTALEQHSSRDFFLVSVGGFFVGAVVARMLTYVFLRLKIYTLIKLKNIAALVRETKSDTESIVKASLGGLISILDDVVRIDDPALIPVLAPRCDIPQIADALRRLNIKHPIGPHLIKLASSAKTEYLVRVSAVRLLGGVKETGALPLLRTLAEESGSWRSSELISAAENAICAITGKYYHQPSRKSVEILFPGIDMPICDLESLLGISPDSNALSGPLSEVVRIRDAAEIPREISIAKNGLGKTKKMRQVEEKIGEPLEAFLRQKIVEEKRTLREVAETLGISSSTLSKWLNFFGIKS